MKFEEERHARTDCQFSLKGNKVVGEIKVRCEGCKYHNELFLEHDKYTAIKEKAKEENAIPCYINFIGNDIMYLFNLGKVNTIACETQLINCRKADAVNRGYKDKIIMLIPKDLGDLYVRSKDGKWKKQ